MAGADAGLPARRSMQGRQSGARATPGPQLSSPLAARDRLWATPRNRSTARGACPWLSRGRGKWGAGAASRRPLRSSWRKRRSNLSGCTAPPPPKRPRPLPGATRCWCAATAQRRLLAPPAAHPLSGPPALHLLFPCRRLLCRTFWRMRWTCCCRTPSRRASSAGHSAWHVSQRRRGCSLFRSAVQRAGLPGTLRAPLSNACTHRRLHARAQAKLAGPPPAPPPPPPQAAAPA